MDPLIKSVSLRTNVTKDEEKRIKERARLAGVSVSHLLRALALESSGLSELILSNYLTTKQVQEKTGMSRVTIQKYRDAGQLPFMRRGSNVLYKRAGVLDFIEARKSAN